MREHEDGERDQHGRDDQREFPRRHGQAVELAVRPAQAAHQRRVALLAVLAQQHGGERGHHGEGRDQRAADGIGVGLGHGAEDAALDAAHGEERDEGHDDDEQREEDGLAHLAARAQHGQRDAREPTRRLGIGIEVRVAPGERQVTVDVLDHDDGRIHQQAEVERADGEQVGALAARQHDHDGEEEGEGDGGRDHDGAAQVAEEEPLDHEDQQHAHDDVVHHHVGGDLHQVLAVVDAARRARRAAGCRQR
jgi:hypothetical protein